MTLLADVRHNIIYVSFEIMPVFAITQRRGFGFPAKPTALSRRRHKPRGIGVPEGVHFTEF